MLSLYSGMYNEMHVYSQWHGPQNYNDVSELAQMHTPSSSALKTATTVAADLLNQGSGSTKMSTLRISQSVSFSLVF